MEIPKPRWSSSSFLVYAGAFTVLSSAIAALAYLSGQYGDAAYAGWALVMTVALLGLAFGFRRERPIFAGVFAFIAVPIFGVFVFALWVWFGWLTNGTVRRPFEGFHVSTLSLVLVTLVFTVGLRRRFRAPILSAPIVVLAWYFITDLVSDGGNWSATVTFVVGLALACMALVRDRDARRPYWFWPQVAAGLFIGGAFIYFWHHTSWDFILIVAGSIAFVRLASITGRSSWAVLAAVGIVETAGHFADRWTHSPWFAFPIFSPVYGSIHASRAWAGALVYAGAGFLLVALGWSVSRRERR